MRSRELRAIRLSATTTAGQVATRSRRIDRRQRRLGQPKTTRRSLIAMRRIAIASIVLVLSLFGPAVRSAWADGATEGSRAPEFDANAKTLSGKKFQLKMLKGKWVLLTFGACWC
jgi:cytochrome oxidase Cu insertion factor (SCO1/SenC/PrrC family)